MSKVYVRLLHRVTECWVDCFKLWSSYTETYVIWSSTDAQIRMMRTLVLAEQRWQRPASLAMSWHSFARYSGIWITAAGTVLPLL